MNFSNLMEENKAFIIKNIETSLLIIKQIRKFQNIRENNFKPEEVKLNSRIEFQNY